MERESPLVGSRGFSFHHSNIPTFRAVVVRATAHRDSRHRERAPDVARSLGGATHGRHPGTSGHAGLRAPADEGVGGRRLEQRVHGLPAATGYGSGVDYHGRAGDATGTGRAREWSAD